MKSNKFVEELKTKSDAELAQELVAAKFEKPERNQSVR